jgi:cytochrome c biogenesis protein
MSTIEQIVTKGASDPLTKTRSRESVLSRFLKLLCSVKFGVILLILLAAACFLGMIVMQQNVDGFERYFAQLTPAQRLVYGSLGIFDIYHVWYFNLILAMLSLNIILSSIDRFPKTWLYVARPTVTVPVRWLREQKQTAELRMDGTPAEVADRLSNAMKSSGWRNIRTGEKGGRTFILAQSGVWNRLGAYAVHVGLLTIFTGGFLTSQMGSTGSLPVSLGSPSSLMYETVVQLDKTNQVTKRLPFEITGTDFQQKLIKKDGSLSAMNTIDWVTRFTIKDETGTHEAFVQMNRPYDYRGYRFFQASFTPIGRARTITVNAKSADGTNVQEVTIPRSGSATLPDGTLIKFAEFRGNFSLAKEDPNENTSDYANPAAVLQVTQPGTAPQTAYAFGPKMANIPIAGKPVAGYTYQLADFEKVADQHILSVQRDPGATVVYVGFILLVLTLIAVFFFSHQRVWASIESGPDSSNKVVFGGNANRNLNSFDERFKKFIGGLANSSAT